MIPKAWVDSEIAELELPLADPAGSPRHISAEYYYRIPFEHSGSVATLEDWFDPRRLSDDYVPTGFKGYGVTARTVKGHPFGLYLSPENRRALVAFFKTL